MDSPQSGSSVTTNRTPSTNSAASTMIPAPTTAHAFVFSFHKRTPDFLEGLVGCLQRLGGVPDKFVLDNDSSIVEPRRPRAPARLHDEVAALFGHVRCQPVVLDPGKPESQGPGRAHDRLLRDKLPAAQDLHRPR